LKVIIQTGAVKFPLTGIGRYTYELSENLRQLLGKENVKYFSGTKFIDAFEKPKSRARENKTFLNTLKNTLVKSKTTARLSHILFLFAQSCLLTRHQKYIYHSPNYYLPRFGGKSVVTIHDLSVFSWAWCHPAFRVNAIQNAINYAVKHATMLITDSEFVKHEIAERYNISLDKIVAIPLAAGDEFKPRSQTETEECLNKYNLAYEQYSLFVSSIEPRKNLKTLLNAYKSIPLTTRSQYPLIIIGYKGWESEDIHLKMLEAEEEGWLKYIGFAQPEDLPCIYSGARLFIFPSYYEGFGLPVLEAMASATPVVCSNSSSLPEVVGNAAAMCEPEDVLTLTKLIITGLEDDTWRAEKKHAGLKQAKKFSWKRCAEETARVYQKM